MSKGIRKMISVCIASYNGAKYIKRQIETIIQQLTESDELIISDDNSTDETLQIIKSFNDERIRLFCHTPDVSCYPHQKVTSNFENAISRAKGDYIFLADQDDVWCDNKINEVLPYFDRFDFIIHNFTLLCNNKKIIKYLKSPLPKTWLFILIKMKLYGCTMAFNRKVLDLALPFPRKLIAHDYWISALALKQARCLYIDKPLIEYRVHDSSVTYKQRTSLFYKIWYRFALFIMIITKSRN